MRQALQIEDLTLEQNVIRVTGKMGERLLPFGLATRKVLLSWLRKRPNLEGADGLFITSRGEPMSKEALRSVMVSLKNKAGLKVRLWPYLLRHTSATSYLQNGGDLELVRRLLGHNSYAVTKRYLSLTAADLARGQRKYSPLSGLR